MTKIDRNTAPEGATHFDPNPADPVWMRRNHHPNRGWDWWGPSGRSWIYLGEISPACEARLIELANPAPAWNGEGLPPAGTVCELRNVPAGTPWSEATIMFASRNVIVWDWVGEPPINGLCTAYAHAVEMRPIRTPEQIAAEEQAKASAQMKKDLEGWKNGHCADYLCSLGYRKQVQS